LLGGAGMQSITQATLTAKQQLDKYQLSNIENTINNKDIKDLFVLNIKDRILSGEITKDQGQAELNSLKESEGVLRQIPDNLSNNDRYTSFKLINERENLRKQMEGKDPALVTPISNRINEINNELKTISENAVQVETTGEIPVQPETAVGGEMAQGEPQAEPKVAAEEGKKEQITAQINIAPLFDTKVTNVQEAESIRQSEMYQNYKKDMSDTAQRFGIQVDNIEDTIGGYEGTSEVSTVVNVTGDWNNIVDFAAVYGAIAPEVQDSTIAGRTVDPQTNEHNADRFDIGIDNQEAALKAAEDAGFSQDCR